MPALLAPPSTFTGTAEAITLLVLLSEFAMLRAPLSRSQIRLYAFQSLVVSGLAFYVAADRHIGDLYAVGTFSFLLKVIVVPAVILRLLKDAPEDLAGSHRLGVASMVLIAIAISVFGLFVVASLPIASILLPKAELGLATAAILVSFLLVIMRSDVVSQAVGFFSLENGVSVASLAIASGLSLVAEVAFFFDLLVAVVVLGVLMRLHHGRARTLSTNEMDRLRG
ncbi:MAG: hydrogenase [Actinobacteria bacterium]|nr:hydrogenase [Actinomycetota bacterium]